jgi:hypothetical protein
MCERGLVLAILESLAPDVVALVHPIEPLCARKAGSGRTRPHHAPGISTTHRGALPSIA